MVNGEPISQYDILVQEKLGLAGDDASKLGGSNIGSDAMGGEFPDIWGGQMTEKGAIGALEATYKHLKGKFTETGWTRYKIKFGTKTYNLKTPGDEQLLKDAIANYDPFDPKNK